MNSSGVDEELRGVVAEPSVTQVVVEEVPKSWWDKFKFWKTNTPEFRLVVTPKWATEVVKATSWPLERYVHPAWALTVEEASKAAPEMQTFLQAFVDRYLPALMKKFVSRHSVLLDMVAALSMVYAEKYKAIRLQIEAEKPGKPVAVPTSIKKEETKVEGEIEHPETATGPESVTCETCGGSFKNALEAAGHLPCKGRIQ